jgi:phage tail-like protein
MPSEKDPLISAWFALEFQGRIEGSFRECTGLGSETQVVEHKATGPKGEYIMKKIPGRMKWNDIVLKQGVTDSMKMWQWRELCEQGKIDEARRNGSLVMFDVKGGEIARWDFINAWPSKLTGPVGNATNNEVALEELTITHEGYKRVK